MSGGGGGTEAGAKSPQLVSITIDGKQLSVPKGMNLIDAALAAGIEIPHYCYHPHLSIAGNCRMCQIAIKGQPKLAIACNTMAAEGLNVETQFVNGDVGDAQRATLEFLLINHPLDCTVCDQAGHCKLQDYHYQYNAKGSRFIEKKVLKVKAEPLGPEVIYDGERCIMCTRCVRFCNEVTGTSELGAFHRGDRGVIGVFPGKELNNPLSGTVVDLCPVGALTHREWRFNSRYWYAKEVDTICTGCSTGCSAKVAVREDKIVQVKARLNSAVNKEWMCDEGRYGFGRFQPATRLTSPHVRIGEALAVVSPDAAFAEAAKLRGTGGSADSEAAVILSPFLTMEEILLCLEFSEKFMGLAAGSASIAMQMASRSLTPVQAKLISPDYAPNARAFSLFMGDSGEGKWRGVLEARYLGLLDKLRRGLIRRLLLVGELAILPWELDENLSKGIFAAEMSVAVTSLGFQSRSGGAAHVASDLCKVILPGRTINEKSGVMVNRDMRFQRVRTLLTAPVGTMPDWMLLNRVAAAGGKPLLKADTTDDRALFREMTRRVPDLEKLTLSRIGPLGVTLPELRADAGDAGTQAQVQTGSTGAVMP